jgi:hypothetical protein
MVKTCQETGRFHFLISELCTYKARLSKPHPRPLSRGEGSICPFFSPLSTGEGSGVRLCINKYILLFNIYIMQNKPFAIVNALMALSYSIIGILLILNPESNFAQMMLPSKTYVYGLGALLIIYGLFRAWRAYQKNKDDDDDGEEYSYYDGKRG